ncbi:MAG TPA: hypothetical protein VJ738_04625 [Steroidobacteraceae bacterium]|nr:hypothetical protein [Steroidobacteraceae bacterium]
MTFDELKRILTAFADSPADLDAGRGILTAQIREEIIEVTLYSEHGDVYVEENGERLSATRWLIQRVARLPLLADRIISLVQPVPNFVVPEGLLTDQLEESKTTEEVSVGNAAATALKILARRPPGTTSVLYLTSHAGEGKTSLINHLARQQAELYKMKAADWLLVPIPLGGRGFLRFDDVTIAALVNRLRFQFFYYEAFVELVRLGVLVPAFDGFEEMFVEGSSGEAVSALGHLVKSLRSSGAVLVAARKAFFEYRSFRTQAKLFDAVGADSVSFARLGLQRWTETQFTQYARHRGYRNAESLFERISARLGSNHPILTRAVLVRRLLDVASAEDDLGSLLTKVGSTPQDYFFQFVNAIVEREAGQKWLDKTGDAGAPLLTVDEHHELLAMIANEMWMSSANSLRADVLLVVAEVFAESKRKMPNVARQIQERIADHPLLVSAGQPRDALSFDHEDFQQFYLGQAAGAALLGKSRDVIGDFLGMGQIPLDTCEHAVLYVIRKGADAKELLIILQMINDSERTASFLRDNCAAIAVSLIHHAGLSGVLLTNMLFPVEALSGRKLRSVTFESCYFQATDIADADFAECRFSRCKFDRLEVKGAPRLGGTLEECEIGSLYLAEKDQQLYDPSAILRALKEYGMQLPEEGEIGAGEANIPDPELELVEKVLRIFLRANHVNELVLRQRMGTRANFFFKSVLPALLKHGILKETSYQGSGNQGRYRLGIQMQEIQGCLSKCGGSFPRFLQLCDEVG